jgi:hypothetical protein
MPDDNTPTPEAPRAQAPAQPAQAPQIQYIVTERSLDGIGGWLIFWIIVFSLTGVGFIIAFFAAISSGFTSGTDINAAIFTPFLAIGYIGSVVLIALRKKLARLTSVGTLALNGLFGAVGTIIAATTAAYAPPLAVTVGGVLASLVIAGLISLYFLLAKRVTQTLVH